MGFDITLHPFKRTEFKYFVEDIVDEPHLVDTRLAAIHDKEEERAFLFEAIYDKIPQFKVDILQGNAEFSNTLGLASAAILGYLYPFWYLRNGFLNNIFENPEFSELTDSLSSIVSEKNKALFDSREGITSNYSSGFFLPFESIQKLVEKLKHLSYKSLVENEIGKDNFKPLLNCLNYCSLHELDLLEATDLCVPFSGESSTFSPNMKALHLKNTTDYKNFSRKNVNAILGKETVAKNIDKQWWNNLNASWRDSIRIEYMSKIRPQFGVNHAKRNAHLEEKFNENTLDLSGIEDLNRLRVSIVDREKKASTLAPAFDFPKLSSLDINSQNNKHFDLSRVLQFPNIDELSLNKILVQNFTSLQELKHLTHLAIGETGLKPTDLKNIKLFPSLKSLFLAFAPYRTVSFLKGNTQLEALTLSYTKGLKDLPNLKRLSLFPKETNPTIIDCPNIEYISCSGARRLKDLSSFFHLSKLKTLFIRLSHTNIDLSLLSEMPNIDTFCVDSYTKLETLTKPIGNIKILFLTGSIDEKIRDLAKTKFPNAEIGKFAHSGYK